MSGNRLLRPRRVFRGGSWRSSPASVRVADRNWTAPSSRDSDLGFRPSLRPNPLNLLAENVMHLEEYEIDLNGVPLVMVRIFLPRGGALDIGKYPVTQAQWKAVMGTNPSHFKGDDLPVESVSWHDCQTFCDKLYELTGVRLSLPSEEDWEFAARGGEDHGFSGSDDPNEVAWFEENSGSRTHPVGQKKPNGFGLYDMSGNVWEWTSSEYK